MLVFELVLTVIAWRRGWTEKALIPILAVLGLGFLVGFYFGINLTVFFFIEAVAYLALLGMVFFPPKQTSGETSEERRPRKSPIVLQSENMQAFGILVCLGSLLIFLMVYFAWHLYPKPWGGLWAAIIVFALGATLIGASYGRGST